ncbi:ribbon-helix-helix domain-containing protein [Bosea sp. AAP35]|uniref:ribbon-helix-helix domain-containing protein n=1 Tax=Bosea sp. AAP35 TaxID=1523417 RepID=UPI0032C1C14E
MPLDAAALVTDAVDGREERVSPLAPSRRGRKALTVHVDLDTHVRLKVMAAREVTTLEALVTEAVDLLFAKRHDRGGHASSDGRHAELDAGMAGRAPQSAGERASHHRG